VLRLLLFFVLLLLIERGNLPLTNDYTTCKTTQQERIQPSMSFHRLIFPHTSIKIPSHTPTTLWLPIFAVVVLLHKIQLTKLVVCIPLPPLSLFSPLLPQNTPPSFNPIHSLSPLLPLPSFPVLIPPQIFQHALQLVTRLKAATVLGHTNSETTPTFPQ
jgi:hypothetical protein